MSEIYRKMRYKKYYIMEPEPFKYPQLEEDRS